MSNEHQEFTWTVDLTRQLIRLYKQYPFLYSRQSRHYTNKFLRCKALDRICQQLNAGSSYKLSPADVRRKIHGLRTQYFHNANKVKRSLQAGAAAYKPSLWFYDSMHFLNETSDVHADDASVDEGEYVTLVVPEDFELLYYVDKDEGVSSYAILSQPGRFNEVELPRPMQSENVKNDGKLDGECETKAVISGVDASNSIFGQFVTMELAKISNEDVLDSVKKEIVEVLFQAKKINRTRG